MTLPLDQHLDDTIALAREAGQLLRDRVDRTVNFQDAKDIKMQADVDTERLIRSRLAATGLPVIGEEQGGDASLLDRDEDYWVVDPLDGTYNYLRGIPQTCVSIGLMRGRDARLGVIYDFNADECFAARRGGSLLLNGHPLQPVWPENRDHAVLITGFPAGRDYSAESLQRFISDIRRFKKIRMLGSAALAMAYVAAGRADAYYEESINLWDIAAGIALVEAAGGTVQRHPSTRPLAFDTWAVAHATWLKA